MRTRLQVSTLCLLSLANSGCLNSSAAPVASNTGTVSPATADLQPAGQAQGAPFLDNGVLEARDLAAYLGISAWAFNYSGGRAKCWLEITENGKTTKFPPEGAQDLNKEDSAAQHGKLIFWMKQGRLEIRLNSGRSTGNYVTTLNDPIWSAGAGPYGSVSTSLQKPVTPGTGDTVTLLRFVASQYDDTPAPPQVGKFVPRKVMRTGTIILKAEFPKDDR